MDVLSFYNIELFRGGDAARPVYGISVVTSFDTVRVPAISENEGQVTEIMELCKRYAVSPVHIEDVARDYLFSRS